MLTGFQEQAPFEGQKGSEEENTRSIHKERLVLRKGRIFISGDKLYLMLSDRLLRHSKSESRLSHTLCIYHAEADHV